MTQRPSVEDLVRRWRTWQGQGRSTSVEELCADCPEQAGELQAHLDAVAEMMAFLGLSPEPASTGPGPSLGPEMGPDPPDPDRPGSRYRVVRDHARGGLGHVFVAMDTELGREVALKEMRARFAGDRVSRLRFVREAEVTGRLEHPGIVPVYGLGRHADGRPYYAMRLIRGESLREAIEALHRGEGFGGDRDARTLALRRLLGRFAAVCDSVAYAHSQGILHRDLKPDNIMLGPYGETLVVDWGLARPMAREDAPGLASDPSPTAAGADPGEAPTQVGTALGTPGFMSPEQAGGELDRLGPGSDVFSLGATLYCLLTGRPPFAGRNYEEILRRARAGDFPRPREVRPDVPRALEAICLKAMATRPEDRYATAEALRVDIEKWLSDEPVSAWREPWATRIRRALARHRAAAATASVSALLLLACLSIATAFLAAANEREREARRVEQQQRDRADANFRLARQAVDRYFTEVSEDRLLRQPGLQPVRQRLLQAALEYYQDFVRQHASDPGLQADLADAYNRVATITTAVGSKEEAIRACRAADDVYARLAAAGRATPELRYKRARNHRLHGITCEELGRRDEALGLYRAALAESEAAARDDPGNLSFVKEHSAILNTIANYYLANGEWERSAGYYRRSLGIRRRLADAAPADAALQGELALVYSNLGILGLATGRFFDSLENHERARAIRQRLVDAHPESGELRMNLARSYFYIGETRAAMGRRFEAAKAFARALEIREELVRTDPRVGEYRFDLARSLHAMGSIERISGRPAEAMDHLRRGLEIQEKLTQGNPRSARYRDYLGRISLELGLLYERLGRREEAAGSLRRAIENHEQAYSRAPDDTDYRRFLADDYAALAALYQRAGDPKALGLSLKSAELRDIKFGPAESYKAARELARAAGLVSMATTEGPPRRRALIDRAMGLLEQAVAGGFRGPEDDPRTDPAFDSVRSQDDFRRLVMDVVFPVDLFGSDPGQ